MSDFQIDEEGCLTRYSGPGGDVVIPDGVTEIGPSAFLRMQQFDEHHAPGRRDKYWQQCFLRLQQPDEHHHPRQRDEYWPRCFS